MEHYFMVLELPGGAELKFVEGKTSPKNFWDKAAHSIKTGKAKLISSRKDTGISEELRKHVKSVNTFKTYVLVHMDIDVNKFASRKETYKKISKLIASPQHETVIDTAENFQLVTVE